MSYPHAGRLLLYDGLPITYDEIGNPYRIVIDQYRGGNGIWEDYGYEYVWNGRQLMGRRYYDDYCGDIWYEDYYDIWFEYNADGIRTSKTAYGVEYKYILNGSQIIGETWTSYGTEYLLLYIYDETGAPIGIKYRTSAYAANTFDYFFFEKNLQGDIVAIYNATGEKIGSYVYDAWGNFRTTTVSGNTSLENSIVNSYNPFRYRGYYYDKDLGWYYLQTRYYNPQWGRFVNADDVAVVTATPMSLTDKNLYAYCDNNPIMRTDEDGEFWNLVIGAVAGAVIGAVTSAITQYISDPESIKTGDFWAHVGVAAVSGAVTGLVAATGVGLAGQVVCNAGMSMVSSVLDSCIDDEDGAVTMDEAKEIGKDALVAGGLGACAGFLGGAGTANNHLQSSFSRAVGNGNWSYYITQVGKEARKAGIKAIPGIARGTIPTYGKTFFDLIRRQS